MIARRTQDEKKIYRKKIISILKEHESGIKIDDLCRQHNIGYSTFHKWKSKYSGMEANETKRMRELETENTKLKRLLADAMLDNIALNDGQLKTRLKELATQYPVYGYLLLHGLLKQEGLVVNKKRTYRLYAEANLQVRTKRRKRLQRPRQPMFVPVNVNERWSMDFVSDQLSNGRRFRILNVVVHFNYPLTRIRTSDGSTPNEN